MIQMFFSLRRNGSFENESLNGFLGNRKWFFQGITVETAFGYLYFEECVVIKSIQILSLKLFVSLFLLIHYKKAFTDSFIYESDSIVNSSY